MNIQFFNIVWDTDGEVVDLPTEVTLEVAADLVVSLEGADTLTDKYGYCVHSFEFRPL